MKILRLVLLLVCCLPPLSASSSLYLVGHPIRQKNPDHPSQYVHPGVYRSFINGAKALNFEFILQPKNHREIDSIAYVPARYETLLDLCKYKNKHKDPFKLIIGPNLYYEDIPHSVLSSADIILVPSVWVKKRYERLLPKHIANKLQVWFVGVDPKYWMPAAESKNTKSILIYYKMRNQPLLRKTTSLVKKLGFEPVIITYGNYTLDEYKNTINASQFAIFLTGTETQGIALAECWAMNVPTFVYQKNYREKFLQSSHAPYLTGATGAFFHNLQELEKCLNTLKSKDYSPRDWVLNNMTNEIAMRKFVEIISTL